jgi:hypothetical protein
MTHSRTRRDGPKLLSAPVTQLPSGRLVTYWNGPPAGREVRAGREKEFCRAERLMAVGIAHVSQQPNNYHVARRCFHAATCLYAWALGADRRLAFAWDRLGYVHQALGNDDEAESCYLRSLAIQDRSADGWTSWNEVTQLNLAILYRDHGRGDLQAAMLAGYDPKAPQEVPGGYPVEVSPPDPPPGRRRRGYSSHGLKMADVVAAFVVAERDLGSKWRLSGRGHCERVVLDACYSRAVRPAIRSWVRISPRGAPSRRTLFPLALVERAAQILGVRLWVIARRGY